MPPPRSSHGARPASWSSTRGPPRSTRSKLSRKRRIQGQPVPPSHARRVRPGARAAHAPSGVPAAAPADASGAASGFTGLPYGGPHIDPVTVRPAGLHRGRRAARGAGPLRRPAAPGSPPGPGRGGVQFQRAQAQAAFHRSGADIHVLHAPVGDHEGALEKDAAADEQVILAFGVADGPHLAGNQHEPPQGQDQHHGRDGDGQPQRGHCHQPTRTSTGEGTAPARR